MREATTEGRATQLAGTDFYLPITGQPRISQMRSWRGPVTTEQGNPGIYVQIDEWLPLYKGNVYVVDEVTGRMYLSKKSHLMRIPEMASHRPMQDHELSVSRHIPEREVDPTPGERDKQKLQYPPTSAAEGSELQGGEGTTGGDMSRTPQPVETSTPQVAPQAPSREGTDAEETVVPRQLTPERDQVSPDPPEVSEGGPGEPSYSLPLPTSHSMPPRPPRLTQGQDRPRPRESSGYPDETTQNRAERIRKRKLAASAHQQILKLRAERDRLEEQLIKDLKRKGRTKISQGRRSGCCEKI